MIPKFVRVLGCGLAVGAVATFGTSNNANAGHPYQHNHCAPIHHGYVQSYRPPVVVPYNYGGYYGGYNGGYNVYRQPVAPAWNSPRYVVPNYGGYGVGGFPRGGSYGGGGWGISIYGR